VDPERIGSAKFDALVDMLRHADASTTRIYTPVVNKMQENPAKFLEAMLTAQVTV
jgi:site-specific recombinase XerD